MTYTVRTAIDALLSTAAATLSPVPTVRAGEPEIVAEPTVAYWFADWATWEANTLSETQRISRWGIRLYWPLRQTIAATSGPDIEDWMVAAVSAIDAEMWGHVGLLGAATGEGAVLSDARIGYADDLQGGQSRVAEWTLDVFLSNVAPIAVGGSTP